jgi:hypothetical protein
LKECSAYLRQSFRHVLKELVLGRNWITEKVSAPGPDSPFTHSLIPPHKKLLKPSGILIYLIYHLCQFPSIFHTGPVSLLMFSRFLHVPKGFNKIALLGLSKDILWKSISALIRVCGDFIAY